jgi:hypothetical protein
MQKRPHKSWCNLGRWGLRRDRVSEREGTRRPISQEDPTQNKDRRYRGLRRYKNVHQLERISGETRGTWWWKDREK